MDFENSHLHDITEIHDDSDPGMSFDEFVEALTPATQDAIRREGNRAREEGSGAAPEPAITADQLPLFEGIVRKLDELSTQFRRRQERPVQEWFSIDEVAVITGLSADHVRRHVVAGTLPVCNQGTHEKPYYRIRRSDIDAWMSQRMQQPGPVARKRKAGPGSYRSRHHG